MEESFAKLKSALKRCFAVGGIVDVAATQEAQPAAGSIDFRTEPSRYRHWRLAFDAPVATLTMDVGEDGGMRPG